jgi:3-oxoacyl-[acyl-carrier-protein] synthase II
MTPVAITGIGVVSPLGHGVDPFWRRLVAGESGLRPIRRFAAPAGALAGEVDELSVASVVRTPTGRRIDRVSLMMLAACRLALADAGIDADGLSPDRTGLAFGSALGNVEETGTFLDRLVARGAGNPLLFPNLVFNAPLSYVSIELGVTGPTAMLSAQEASGEVGIATAADMIAEGAADVCLGGGGDEICAVLERVAREAIGVARGAPRPLDRASDGSIPGEGAAILVLEPLARARGRGARVYARLVRHAGFAVPAPVHGWARDPAAIADGLAAVAADADVVFAAASGRPALDAVEASALARAVRPGTAITAVRGAVGDFGAAGALATAAAACAIFSGMIPPTLNVVPPARAGLDVVSGSARHTRVRTALVNGLARGGVCRPLRLESAA